MSITEILVFITNICKIDIYCLTGKVMAIYYLRMRWFIDLHPLSLMLDQIVYLCKILLSLCLVNSPIPKANKHFKI